MPEIPAETLHRLYREFVLARFDYGGSYKGDEAREAHIAADAASYAEAHGDGDWRTPLAVLVEAAYAAGQESALTREEWRIVASHPRTKAPIVNNNARAEWEARALFKVARKFDPDARLESRRSGSTDWERVPDAEQEVSR